MCYLSVEGPGPAGRVGGAQPGAVPLGGLVTPVLGPGVSPAPPRHQRLVTQALYSTVQYSTVQYSTDLAKLLLTLLLARSALPHIPGIELSTRLHEVSQCPEKDTNC